MDFSTILSTLQENTNSQYYNQEAIQSKHV